MRVLVTDLNGRDEPALLNFVGLSACAESRTTPVSWGDFHYTNEAIQNYENKMHDIAVEQGIPFIPVFNSFLQALGEGRDFLPDGLHPNNEGHLFMSQLILDELAPLLVN